MYYKGVDKMFNKLYEKFITILPVVKFVNVKYLRLLYDGPLAEPDKDPQAIDGTCTSFFNKVLFLNIL